MLNLPVTGIVHNFCTTPIYSAIINLGRGSDPIRSAGFKPTQLFTSNTNGVWYDPSDINLTWRRNLLKYTEQFDNAAWGKIGASVSSTKVAAPDSTLTAYTVTFTASANDLIRQSVTTSPNTYTYSIYARAATGTKSFALSRYGVSAGQSTTQFTATTAWQRFSITVSANAESTYWYVYNGSDAQAGDLQVWGAQLEISGSATTYQKITDGIQDYYTYQSQPTLFQDAAGTTPVTAVGQPVGLMLDKSKGLVLGNELVTNGDFSTDTNWTKETGWSISGGAAVATASPNGNAIRQAATITLGKSYNVTITVLSVSSGGVYVSTGYSGTGVNSPVISSPGTYTYKLQGGNFAQVYVITSGTTTATIDNISVRELPGNHAYNPSGNSANFPVLSARYNLLMKTEQFDDTGVWLSSNLTSSVNSITASTTGSYRETGQAFNFVAGVAYKWRISVKADSSGWVYVTASDRSANAHGYYFNVSVGVVGSEYTKVGSLIAASSPVASPGSNGYFDLTITLTSSSDRAYYCTVGVVDGDASPVVTAGKKVFVNSADLRVANDALNQPAYQRVNTATDYDTVGFKPYLSFNGVNQWLQTNSIDFTYGDKMFVCAGVRKLSDAAIGAILQFGDIFSTVGSFYVTAAQNNDASYGAGTSGGSGTSTTITKWLTYTAPLSNVVTVTLNNGGATASDQVQMRVNSSVGTRSGLTTGAGSGNFTNQVLQLGRRNSFNFLNGRLYGLVVAGKQATSDEITNAESFLAIRTGYIRPDINGIPTIQVSL